MRLTVSHGKATWSHVRQRKIGPHDLIVPHRPFVGSDHLAIFHAPAVGIALVGDLTKASAWFFSHLLMARVIFTRAPAGSLAAGYFSRRYRIASSSSAENSGPFLRAPSTAAFLSSSESSADEPLDRLSSLESLSSLLSVSPSPSPSICPASSAFSLSSS